jgi:hypothetical protein
MIQATPQATLWPVPAGLAGDFAELVELERQAKEADARRQALKARLAEWADGQFTQAVRTSGRIPEGPLRLVGPDGDSLAYVLASGTKELRGEDLATMQKLLGDELDGLVVTRHGLAVEVPAVSAQAELVTILWDLFSAALVGSRKLTRHLSPEQRAGLLTRRAGIRTPAIRKSCKTFTEAEAADPPMKMGSSARATGPLGMRS